MTHISEKRKCNFYNVGYCKHLKKGCRFVHPEESCGTSDCQNRGCPKRHQTTCKYFGTRRSCKHGSDCQFKHEEKKNEAKKENLDEDIKVLKENLKGKEEMIKAVENEIILLNDKLKEHEESESSIKYSFEFIKNEVKNKNFEIETKDQVIKEQADTIAKSQENVINLEKSLVAKNIELNREMKRNEIMQKLMKKKDEDLKKFEPKLVEKEINFSCGICNFVSKNKTGLANHKTQKHKNIQKVDDNVEQVIKTRENSNNDDFTSQVNNFLQSVNYLNNSENIYSCDKCEAKFSSKEFLGIHQGATHKIKCDECEYETGHNDLMKEHTQNPGIFHSKKK